MIFQKKPRSQENRYLFTLGDTVLGHTLNYDYLGLKISASGSFGLAVNALKEKACRAFYAIKRRFHKTNIPIRIWLKIFDCVIQPIMLYGSEIWGPLSQQDYTKWEKHPAETLHAEFCKNILQVHSNAPNNACRAELGRFPTLIQIQKRALNFIEHLKMSPTDSLQFLALQTQELSPGKYPLSQLVLNLSRLTLTHTNANQLQTSTASQQPIRVNQIIKHIKNSYLDHWNKETQSQNKLNCYRALNRKYTLAEYLFSVRDTKQRRILTGSVTTCLQLK
ncbi:hypothetical protein ANANG_G00196080 [Anguilla anguilla]|uniref:Uncharacterized protein n=1 Tax=Anguilla anguilla TaxID=7936 RepID=A0A9D3RT95_ANGAN|nr:hypothetical protein ANANG_G00196080 [Anguilla anguilla]